ncbi:MAG: HelD family protein [Bacillota bacterium]
MADDLHDMAEERAYLVNTMTVLNKELAMENDILPGKRSRLLALRRDLWENTVHFTDDYDRLAEIKQYHQEVENQTASYHSTYQQIEKYKKLLASPYFGRFDFLEEDSSDREQIYLGLATLIDSETHNILIYDWRAPLSSVFYRHELGAVSYEAPSGTIFGDVSLKRQYKIQHSQLKYYFDCSVIINDEILQEALGNNALAKMKNIAETIQKEQDLIIRDTEHDILFVQGVAGSGKTSIALHRIAYLLYTGINSGLRSHHMLIVSPNAVFSKYISNVLPELGEENARQTTFEDLVHHLLQDRLAIETRNAQLESLIVSQNSQEAALRKQCIEFKGSTAFIKILDRLIAHYERHLIDFEDIYYCGRILATRQQLKNLLLNDKIGMPLARRLKRIKHKMLEQISRLRKVALEKIERVVQLSEGHDLEIRSFSRLLSIKQTRPLRQQLRRVTEVDYLQLYKFLFSDRRLFLKLAQGIALPESLEWIISSTMTNLDNNEIDYEDSAPLLYLKLSIDGCDLFTEIKHVVIDEAQNYYPLQHAVFKLLFNDGVRYTVLGDTHQTIERDTTSLLDVGIAKILGKSNPAIFSLYKSYRSSFEISAFTQKLPEIKQEFIAFERHGTAPMVVCRDSAEAVTRAMADDLEMFLEQGYASVAVICKTAAEAQVLTAKLKKLTGLELVDICDKEFDSGVLVIPAYMANGLEFDVVLIHGASKDNFSSHLDRKLLYIACTRALHRLALYYTGEKSPFI